jgi:hypothetical protein
MLPVFLFFFYQQIRPTNTPARQQDIPRDVFKKHPGPPLRQDVGRQKNAQALGQDGGGPHLSKNLSSWH